MCAAPGGKTIYVAELMEDTGRLDAWDIHTPRVGLIDKNAARMGLSLSLIHILFIAGAISTGARVASTVVVSISSAIPQASLPITFAVAGAITMISAFFASEICSIS